jgi:hypothetical protein
MKVGVILLLCGMMLGHTFAQGQGDAPIFFLMDGDLWSYRVGTGQLTQESTWGYNEAPILSPDGRRFAYLSLAQQGVDLVETNGYLFDPQPTNIWVWDLASNEAERIVQQPSNINVDLANGIITGALDRRSLAWSPDSNQLAWIVVDGDSYQFSLMTYDLTTRTERLLSKDIPYPFSDAGVVGEQELRWGPGGIAVLTLNISDTPDVNRPPFQTVISVYDPSTGAKIAENVVANDPRYVNDLFWIDSNQILLLYTSGERVIYFVNTGGLVGAAQLQFYSPNNPQSPVQVSLEKYLSQEALPQQWSILWPNGQPQFWATQSATGQIALSPNGEAIAYLTDSLYLWQNGTIIQVPGTESLADEYAKGLIWGPMQWRMVGVADPDPFPSCALAPRLSIGGQALVIPGLGANVLRDLPGKNAQGSTVISQIPPNTILTILDGPQCASAIHWWQVDYNGQIGWTGEGENGTYWLEPR